jgi:hypothetical protein
MNIVRCDLSDKSVKVVIEDKENDFTNVVNVYLAGHAYSVSGGTLTGSRHDKVCQAMAVALTQMTTGDNITELP